MVLLACTMQDTCPTCLEKVDLRSVFADRPWETRNLTWCACAGCTMTCVTATSVTAHLWLLACRWPSPEASSLPAVSLCAMQDPDA